MVDEQTREIKSILQNIQIGILLIKKPGLKITETHSQSALKILNCQDLVGTSIMNSVIHHLVLSDEARSQVEAVLDNCLEEESISFEMNAHLLPTEVLFRSGSEERMLQLEWDSIVDKAGKIEKIILAIKDITLLKQLELSSKEQSKEIEMIGEILNVSTREFGVFMNSAQSFMAENSRILKANRKLDFDALKLLFINYHTIKGAARSLGLKLLTPIIHDVEQNIARIMQKEVPLDWETIWQKTRDIQECIDQYQQLNQVKLGRDPHMAKSFSYEEIDLLNQVLRQVEKEGSVNLKLKAKPFLEMVESIRFAPAEHIFQQVLTHAEMLARDLGKEVPTIDIQGKGIQLSLQGQDLIRKTFIHIIRNSMDHGIETADERQKSGKQGKGHISVQLSVEGSRLTIRYRDDGRGLNLRTIRRLAIDKHMIDAQQRLTREEIASLIFEPGLSTSTEANDISGRGVGMSAVKEYFEHENGQVEVRLLSEESLPELGYAPFEFIFTLGETIFFQKAS